MRIHTERVCGNGQESLAHLLPVPPKRRYEWPVRTADVARKSVPIPFRITMVMKIKDLPTAGVLCFSGVRAPRASFEILKLK
jgi:hypothetical protein